MKPALLDITARIRGRSAPTRQAYLARVERLAQRPRGSDRMGCANVAHAFAALPGNDKFRVVAERAPHIGIVTAYNDMLSAHQPYEGFSAPRCRSPAACLRCATASPRACRAWS
jgi:phosphogluconate dehydratase